MVQKLSSNYQKQIAFLLVQIFLIPGVASFARTTSYETFATPSRSGSFSVYPNKFTTPFIPKKDNASNIIPLKTDDIDLNIHNKTDDHIENLGGPSQPEMSGFKPVGADNMVDLFSGDFSYNIPLLDVGGYPVNIFYNSGVTMDQEASWAGLGWNINPGTISRNMRGIPDDFNGTEKIAKTHYTKPERTYGLGVCGSLKTFPIPIIKLSANFGLFYNNMRGLGAELGLSPAVSIGSKTSDPETSSLKLGWSLQGNSQTGGSSSLSISLCKKGKDDMSGSMTASLGYHSRMGLQSLHLSAEASKSKENANYMKGYSVNESNFSMAGSTMSFAFPAITPSIRTKLEHNSYNLNLGVGVEIQGINPNLRLKGYYTESKIPKDAITTNSAAYGMLFMQDANGKKDALLDFNRLNEGMYTPNSPITSLPVYTFDVFSISGEGTGGTFKAQRADLGYVCDPTVEVGGGQFSLGADLGGGTYLKAGLNGNAVLTPSFSGVWSASNLARKALGFKQHDGLYRSVYFRNPGEKAIQDNNLQNTLGGDDMVRLKMTNLGNGSPVLLPTLVKYDDLRQIRKGSSGAPQEINLTETNTKKERDKRSQVISFLSAEEADRAGLNKSIPSVKDITESAATYFGPKNSLVKNIARVFANSSNPSISDYDSYRLSHHISEIDVLQGDGKRYVYDVPVYNTKQVDVTFNSNGKGNSSTQLADYADGSDNKAENNGGKDGYVERQEMPAYTHSFLLSSILSSNYVDVTGDGITEDDLGDAIKFNYGRVGTYKWRTPHDQNKASYSEGLKLSSDDDKSHYIYGEREMWYLHTLESKNMVARFYATAKRCDGKSALGETGGLDKTFGSYKLEKISLYSKADLVKKEADPTYQLNPIKTVHFEYDYSLCGETPDNALVPTDKNGMELTDAVKINDPKINVNYYKGKLTLRRIYFTYNGNEKEIKNSYRFNYGIGDKNPKYNYTANDRWGNYKPESDNPNNLKNGDFPYVIQDKTIADKNIATWALNEIKLPSGGAIKVDYESDDYAYVQDRRASNMTQIIGFGNNTIPQNLGQLKNNQLFNEDLDQNNYIYIKVPKVIDITQSADVQKQQIKSLYLANLDKCNQAFMKLAVHIKSSSAIEFVPLYGDIESYGVIPTGIGFIGYPNGSVIFLKIKNVESGLSPMTQYSLQFMKNYLPEMAYPSYNTSNSNAIEATIRALAGAITSIAEIFSDQMKKFMKDSKCRYVDLNSSFARLTDGNFYKYGGGLRVKRINIYDNFDLMTQKKNSLGVVTEPGMKNATYGQEYFYTKKETINNKLETISSGVALWEPSLGGEENPHRQTINYFNKTKMGPYDFSTVELPLAEMLFPSPSVGYSRVEVKSIHRDNVKNAPGIQVSEYYTAREFPTKSNYTPLEEWGAKDQYEPSPLMSVFSIDINKSVALSQGFKVETNDMHGKLRKQSSFSPLNLTDPISYTENFYSITPASEKTFNINHKFKVIQDASGKVEETNLGKDIELMTDFREHQSQTITINPEFNLDVLCALFPIPIPTFFSPFMMETVTFKSATMTKVINHYGTLDSVVAVDKGSMISTKNLVYDAKTGDVLLTRTENEHKQPLYNFSYPGHWAYEGMGFAYKNIDAAFSGLEFRNGRIAKGMENQDLNKIFESGDELYVISKKDKGPDYNPSCEPPNVEQLPTKLFHPTDAGNSVIMNTPHYIGLTKNSAERIWAINTSKVASATPNWYFIDRKGNGYTAKDAYIRIIRSGKRNILNSGLGSVALLNNPIVGNYITLGNSSKVLQTAAATYKDHWRVEDSYSLIPQEQDITNLYPKYMEIGCDETVSVDVKSPEINSDFNFSPGLLNISKITQNDPGLYIQKSSTYFNPDSLSESKAWTQFDIKPLINKKILSVNFKVVEHTDLLNYATPNLIDSRHSNMPGDPFIVDPYHFAGYASYLKASHYNSLTLPDIGDINSWKSTFTDNNATPIFFDINEGYSMNESFFISKPINGYPDYNEVQTFLENNKSTLLSKLNYSIKLETYHKPYLDPQGLFYSVVRNRNCLFGNDPNSYPSPPSYVQNFAYTKYRPKLGIWYFDECDGELSEIKYSTICYAPTAADCKLFKMSDCHTCSPATEYRTYPYVTCTKTTSAYCASKFTDNKSVNPYVQGIWGNWRADSTYVYYGDRDNSSIASSPNIDTRTAGLISNFKPFWNFDATNAINKFLSRNPNATNVWVWNSTVTQFNKKGYDIENKDPLGRYNAGLYGYSQQLPIAVINNSRYRESMFDGFEDYGYTTIKTDATALSCIPARHAQFNNGGTTLNNGSSNLTDEDKHSGKYSLKINSGETISLGMSVSTPNNENDYSMRIRVDSPDNHFDTVFSSIGGGLICTNNGSSCNSYQSPNFDNDDNDDGLNRVWEGYIQPIVSGEHYFQIIHDDAITMWLTPIPNSTSAVQSSDIIIQRNDWTVNGTQAAINLNRGQLYRVKIQWNNLGGGRATCIFRWKHPSITDFENVPTKVLYSTNAGNNIIASLNTINPIVNNRLPKDCPNLDSINVRGNALTDHFELVPGKKMVFSAWVKEKVTDCKVPKYENNSVSITFSGTSVIGQQNLKPSGSIIEGWQRYEVVFQIPNDATGVSIELNALSNITYFDDIRIHPYNANMKSFVYHPSNLRLMAELDENNYATYYEYDDDGTLTRLKKETERGVKTIKETRSALQKATEE